MGQRKEGRGSSNLHSTNPRTSGGGRRRGKGGSGMGGGMEGGSDGDGEESESSLSKSVKTLKRLTDRRAISGDREGKCF